MPKMMGGDMAAKKKKPTMMGGGMAHKKIKKKVDVDWAHLDVRFSV